jgi:UDPglucose 6-dehydrogenase
VAAYDPKAADALVICTEWKRYRYAGLRLHGPQFRSVGSSPAPHLIFDGRNFYDTERLADLGWTNYPIGRGASVSPVA